MHWATDHNRQHAAATPTIVGVCCVSKALRSAEIHTLYSFAPRGTGACIVDFVSHCQSERGDPGFRPPSFGEPIRFSEARSGIDFWDDSTRVRRRPTAVCPQAIPKLRFHLVRAIRLGYINAGRTKGRGFASETCLLSDVLYATQDHPLPKGISYDQSKFQNGFLGFCPGS